jgi:hypothetical protein
MLKELTMIKIEKGEPSSVNVLTKSLNVLTKQEELEELLLEAISKINDPELKANMLHKLRNILNKEKTNDLKTPKPTISLSETLERFNKLKPKKVNLEYLQLEINQIKREIKQLKIENNNLESKIANLEDRVSILELNKKFKLLNNQNDSSSEDEIPESSTPSNITSRIHDQLSNLKCPTMSDFRWYEDVFISRVMLREDSNKSFWKEKFINGLPNLFAHKIRTVLSNSNGIIDYDTLTYGDIISTIKQEGLKMCIEQKIAKQQNDNKRNVKYEMRNFYEQYGILSIAPSQKKHIKHRIEKYKKLKN